MLVTYLFYIFLLTFICPTILEINILKILFLLQSRAKLFFKAGFKDLGTIARSTPEVLASSVYFLPLKHAKKIIEGAKVSFLFIFFFTFVLLAS